ncbi:uncharacterized protein LOC142350491 [Convolutriloba macropyga]|uniref:uncharacterized protein LOC142350491 n=1 Tax=Convolutriloba macropyga TaxID=536237 RepID=UPI003F521876
MRMLIYLIALFHPFVVRSEDCLDPDGVMASFMKTIKFLRYFGFESPYAKFLDENPESIHMTDIGWKDLADELKQDAKFLKIWHAYVDDSAFKTEMGLNSRLPEHDSECSGVTDEEIENVKKNGKDFWGLHGTTDKQISDMFRKVLDIVVESNLIPED